jgi:lipid II:glycine glycyltransferase (peptidoglycan interpeptide bridge formation enzyme)
MPRDVKEIMPSLSFYGHEIDLTKGEPELWSSFKSRVRTPVRRAQEAGVTIQFETHAAAIRTYYKLHSRTRKKHGLPPQPLSFFLNIQQYLVDKGCGFIAVASWQGQPIAAGVFLHLGKRVVHKFGASDPRFQKLGGNHMLMWETIRKCRNDGFMRLHLGRTSVSNDGLRQFKLGFSATEHEIHYCKYDYHKGVFVEERDQVEGWYNTVFRLLPEPVLRLMGRILYSQMA